MVSSNTAVTQAQPSSSGFRWMQLVMGIVCMAMIANLQYGWTLFVDPIDGAHHWGRAAIQFAFTIFVVTETWLVPVEAWFVDKYGPRLVIMFGGVMIALAWVLNSYADSLPMLYAAAVIGGIGAGAVYGTCVGNALEVVSRSPRPRRRRHRGRLRRRALRMTVVPIANMIASSGYRDRVLRFRHRPGTDRLHPRLLHPAARRRDAAAKKQLNLPQTKIDFTPPQVLRSPIFWVMYLVFVMVASGGSDGGGADRTDRARLQDRRRRRSRSPASRWPR